MFKCVCLTCAVGLPWKPLPLRHVKLRFVVPVFVAMKLRMIKTILPAR